MNDDQRQPPTKSEFYKIIRTQLDQEKNLVLQKVNWFIWGQSFLVSAFAIILNAPKDAKLAVFAHEQDFLAIAIPYSAIATTLITFCGIISSLLYTRELTKIFRDVRLPEDEMSKLLPPIEGATSLRWMGGMPSIALPIGAVILWILILTHWS